MNCVRCKSPRTMKFVDGFGSHRIFCRTCHVSYINDNFFFDQTKIPQLQEFFHTNLGVLRSE